MPSLVKGHPWIYRDHLPSHVTLETGSWVKVVCRSWAGLGLYDAHSPLAIRVFGRYEEPSASWFKNRIASALRRRKSLLRDGTTNAFRMVNGEGDRLPGLVVDVYGQFAAIRLDSGALKGLLPWIVPAIQEVLQPHGICQRNGEKLEVLAGRAPPSRLIVSENGLRFLADIATGQKTGLFLDHRENRARLEAFCPDQRVLNLFSYTGGFSLYAARAGATEVVSVDRAGDAMSRAEDNVKLNGMDATRFQFVTADALKYLEQAQSEGQQFGVVISDPPSFARNRTQRRKALKAYEKLHTLCLSVLEPEGVYAAASCTSQVDRNAFAGSVLDAATRLRRPLQIIQDSGQAIDHPISAGHPEGRYLKFIAFRCLQ